jgi:hypothetical protein
MPEFFLTDGTRKLTNYLDFDGVSQPALSPTGDARIYFDGTDLYVSKDGGAYELLGSGAAGGGGGGDGTYTEDFYQGQAVPTWSTLYVTSPITVPEESYSRSVWGTFSLESFPNAVIRAWVEKTPSVGDYVIVASASRSNTSVILILEEPFSFEVESNCRYYFERSGDTVPSSTVTRYSYKDITSANVTAVSGTGASTRLAVWGSSTKLKGYDTLRYDTSTEFIYMSAVASSGSPGMEFRNSATNRVQVGILTESHSNYPSWGYLSASASSGFRIGVGGADQLVIRPYGIEVTGTTKFGGYTLTWPTTGAEVGKSLKVSSISGTSLVLSWGVAVGNPDPDPDPPPAGPFSPTIAMGMSPSIAPTVIVPYTTQMTPSLSTTTEKSYSVSMAPSTDTTNTTAYTVTTQRALSNSTEVDITGTQVITQQAVTPVQVTSNLSTVVGSATTVNVTSSQGTSTGSATSVPVTSTVTLTVT